MRILHIVSGAGFGGGSIIIFNLAKMAKSRGWQCDVTTTIPFSQHLLQSAGIGIISENILPNNMNPILIIKGIFKLYHLLTKNQYDMIHTHTSKAGFIGRLAGKIAGIPIILHTIHGFAFHEQTSHSKTLLFSNLERLAAHWSDMLVTVSEFHRHWAIRLSIAKPGKVVAIPNGIPPERVNPKIPREKVRSSLGVYPDHLVIISIGRLAEQKGLEYLIEAVPILKKLISRPFKLILAGEGPLKTKLQRLIASLGIEDWVHLIGFCGDVGSLLSASDIFALPSLREGLSISLLEAMAASKPIVASQIGSNVEALGNGEAGVLVPTQNAEKLAEALAKLAVNPDLRQKYAYIANTAYKRKYTLDQMLDGYAAVYEQLYQDKDIHHERFGTYCKKHIDNKFSV